MNRPGAGWVCAAACAGAAAYVLRGVPWALALSPGTPESWAVDPRFLAAQAGRLALAATLYAVWTGIGVLLLKPLRLPWRDRWEEAALSFSVGAGVWGSGLHLAGLAGLWRPWLLALAAGLGLWPAALWLKSLRGARPSLPGEPWARAALAACAAVLAFNLPLTLLPETFYDALNYHLAIPNLYLLRGAVVPTPENSYSGVPSIPMMLFGQSLAFDSWGIAARLTHLMFLPAVLVALRGTAARLGTAAAWPLSAALFCLAPVVLGESIRASTGLEWTLFQLAAFHAFVAAAGAPRGSKERRNWLLVSGSALGFALSTKYLAGAAALGLAAGLIWSWRGEEGSEPFSLREGAFLFGTAVLWLAPWLARNAAFYGNPIYPLFQGFFNPAALWQPDWSRVTGQGLEPASLFAPAALGRWLLHPVLWSRSEAEFGGAFGPAFLGLVPAVLAVSLGGPGRLWAVLCAASWLPLSLVAHDVTRYMVPGLAPWAVLSALALARLPDASRRTAAWAGVAAAAAGAAAFCVMRLPAFVDLGAALGSVPPWEYLAVEREKAAHPTPPHAAYRWLEERAAPGERALIVGDARHFPLRVDHLASSEDQRSWLEVLADQSSDGADLARRLVELRVRYIVTNKGESLRVNDGMELTRRGAGALKEFWGGRTSKVFELNDHGAWVVVHEVR